MIFPALLEGEMRVALAAQEFRLSNETVAGRAVIVAYRAYFTWVLVRLHVFVVLCAEPVDELSANALAAFSDAVLDQSISNKPGLARGLQSGSATMLVMTTTSTRPEINLWARRGRHVRFAAEVSPVVVDLESGVVTVPRIGPIGIAFAHLRAHVVKTVVRSSVAHFCS